MWERGDWVKKIEPLVKECSNKVKETRFVRPRKQKKKRGCKLMIQHILRWFRDLVRMWYGGVYQN